MIKNDVINPLFIYYFNKKSINKNKEINKEMNHVINTKKNKEMNIIKSKIDNNKILNSKDLELVIYNPPKKNTTIDKHLAINNLMRYKHATFNYNFLYLIRKII